MPARLFTFNSISTRYSVIMVAIISKLPRADINFVSKRYLLVLSRCTRCTYCTFIRIGAITSKHRARVHYRRPAASHLCSSFPPQCLYVLRCNNEPDAYCIPLRRPLFLGIATEFGLRFIRCNYRACILCSGFMSPFLCRDQFQ